MKITLLKSLALAVLASPFPARAEEGSTAATPPAPAAVKLVVGSPVPAFKPEKWIQGDPVTTFEKDKTYLIECWATWCGPCVAAIPHVNALHEKFKDRGLVVIGMNVWENPVSKAEALVKAKGTGMTYRVAYDGGDSGAFSRDWLIAAGQTGIPHTFVVRNNQIHWQGHPGELSEETMAAMLDGKFDTQKAAADSANKEQAMMKMGAADREFRSLVAAKKPNEAAAKLALLVKLAPGLGMPPEMIALMERDGQAKIALAQGDAAKAVSLMKQNVPTEGSSGNRAAAGWLHTAKFIITTPELGEARDYTFALDCIGKSIAADPSFEKFAELRLLKARALYASGKKDESLQLVEQAAEHGIVDTLIDEYKTIREALKAGKPWPEGEMNPG